MTETGADAAPPSTGVRPEPLSPGTEASPHAVQLTISVPDGDAAEALAAVVWGGAGGEVPPPDGVEERDPGDGSVRWVISWIDPPDVARMEILGAELRRCGAVVLDTATVAHDEGLDAWRDHASVWRAGPFAVRPPWLDAPAQAGTLDLVIDPGATFGSGSHQSTRMALDLLGGLSLGGATVVDVGSGSGILGIAAALLGAARVDLVELDGRGEDVGLSNARRNGVADRVRWAGTDAAALADGRDAHDEIAKAGLRVVVANMLIGELEAVAPSLRGLADIGGVVVVAGILEHQVDRLEAAVGPHCLVDSVIAVSETDPSVSWAALALELESGTENGVKR